MGNKNLKKYQILYIRNAAHLQVQPTKEYEVKSHFSSFQTD
jgi:hypothetical protein